MNKHAKLRQTNQFTSNFLAIPRCQRSSQKIRQKGPKADLGTKGFVRFNWKKLHRIFITQNYKLSHNIQFDLSTQNNFSAKLAFLSCEIFSI